jgi:tetratricopeptide (TPR) repeat protein
LKFILHTLGIATLIMAVPVQADSGLDQAILGIQHQWEHINYEVPDTEKPDAYEKLEQQEDVLVRKYSHQPEPLIWYGITLSSHAGAKGGLGALSLAKQARNQLMAAERINPDAMQGSIYTSLGTLYYKVPGWPVGFGDDSKAEFYLKKAVQVSPNGIDSNYFYGDFLYGKHRYQAAMQYLDRALAARPRPERPLADKGRRQEIEVLMAKIESETGESIRSSLR